MVLGVRDVQQKIKVAREASPEAVAGHRLLCTPQMVEKRLPQRFWKGGPERVQSSFAAMLRRRIETGEDHYLEIIAAKTAALFAAACRIAPVPPGVATDAARSA